MGLSVVELDGGLAQELGLPVSRGLVVVNSWKNNGRLKPFDFVEVNGYPVKKCSGTVGAYRSSQARRGCPDLLSPHGVRMR